MANKLVELTELIREASQKGIIRICHTMDGAIIGASTEALSLFGYSDQEIQQIYLAHIRPKKLRLSDVCRSNKTDIAPTIFSRRDGSRFPARVKSQAVKVIIDGLLHNALVMDITVVANEGSQGKKDAPLLDVNSTSRYLELLAQQACAPVSGIRSIVQMLDEVETSAKNRRFFQMIQRLSDELTLLVDDLDDTFKAGIGALKLQEQPFNLVDMLDEWRFSAPLEHALDRFTLGVVVQADVPELVFGDAKRLAQVLNGIATHIASLVPDGELEFKVALAKEPDSLSFRIRVNSHSLASIQRNQQQLSDEVKHSLHVMKASRLIQQMSGELELAISTQQLDFCFSLLLPEVDSMDLVADRRFLSDVPVWIAADLPAAQLRQFESWGGQLQIVSATRNPQPLDDRQRTVVTVIDDKHRPLLPRIEKMAEGRLLCLVWAEKAEQQYLADLVLTQKVAVMGNQLANRLAKPVPYPYSYCSQQRLKSERSDQRRVLLVESNVNHRDLIRSILDDYGFAIDVAHNGMDAVLAAADYRYCLIIISTQLPFMDGLETVSHLRKNTALNKQTPVVALDENITPNLRIACQEAGVAHLMKKPVEVRQFMSVLEALLLQSEKAALAANGSDMAPQIDRRLLNHGGEAFSVEVDVEMLEQLQVDIGYEVFNEMLALYVKELDEASGVIEQVMHSGRVTLLSDVLNGLISSSQSFGCLSLHKCASELLAMNENAERDEVNQSISRLVDVIGQSKSHVIDRFWKSVA